MDITQFLSIAVIILSIIFGGVYVWLQSTPYLQTVILVLTTSSTVYALAIK